MEPIFSSPDDGLEYYGEYLANIGIMLPFYITQFWSVNNVVEWLLRGIVTSALICLWTFTVGWILVIIGLFTAIIGESYNNSLK